MRSGQPGICNNAQFELSITTRNTCKYRRSLLRRSRPYCKLFILMASHFYPYRRGAYACGKNSPGAMQQYFYLSSLHQSLLAFQLSLRNSALLHKPGLRVNYFSFFESINQNIFDTRTFAIFK